MAAFTKEQVAAALDAKAAHLTKKDVERIAKNKDTVLRMVQEFPEAHGQAQRQAVLLLDIIVAGTAPAESLTQAAAALIYLGAPIDLVPDHEEHGYSDDAAIVALAVARIEESVRVHCAERHLDLKNYL